MNLQETERRSNKLTAISLETISFQKISKKNRTPLRTKSKSELPSLTNFPNPAKRNQKSYCIKAKNVQPNKRKKGKNRIRKEK